MTTQQLKIAAAAKLDQDEQAIRCWLNERPDEFHSMFHAILSLRKEPRRIKRLTPAQRDQIIEATAGLAIYAMCRVLTTPETII
ncbi:MAG: hypothetical protein R3B90_21880 [Planctomycetaceae bacterium]